MNQKYLFKLEKNEFKQLIESLEITHWKIVDEIEEIRYETIKNHTYSKILKDNAKKKEILKPKNYKQIISWLDTMFLLYKTIKNINPSLNFNILQEYTIPTTKNRIDFVLYKDNKILLLEFSYGIHNNKWDVKEEQVNNYKKMLKNLLTDDYLIETYRIIYMQDYNKNFTNCKESINKEIIKSLENYINNFFQDTKKIPNFFYYLDRKDNNNENTPNYSLEYLKVVEQYNALLNEYENLKKQNDKLQSENNILRIRMKEIRDITNKA